MIKRLIDAFKIVFCETSWILAERGTVGIHCNKKDHGRMFTACLLSLKKMGTTEECLHEVIREVYKDEKTL